MILVAVVTVYPLARYGLLFNYFWLWSSFLFPSSFGFFHLVGRFFFFFPPSVCNERRSTLSLRRTRPLGNKSTVENKSLRLSSFISPRESIQAAGWGRVTFKN